MYQEKVLDFLFVSDLRQNIDGCSTLQGRVHDRDVATIGARRTGRGVRGDDGGINGRLRCPEHDLSSGPWRNVCHMGAVLS